jgi:D-alanine-D-alanine ligase
VSGRASLHVHLAEDETELPEVVAKVYHETQNHVLIEAYLPGREYCVAVSGHVVAKGGQLTRRSEPFVFAAVERVLESDERIFTSMDVRPISAERVRALDPAADADVIGQLHELARGVFTEMNLESLIRLDVRADAEGRLNILEANPKADLKAPTPEKTSIICAGLPSHGMTYDDLILSLMADRIDLLLSYHRDTVSNLTELLD